MKVIAVLPFLFFHAYAVEEKKLTRKRNTSIDLSSVGKKVEERSNHDFDISAEEEARLERFLQKCAN